MVAFKAAGVVFGTGDLADGAVDTGFWGWWGGFATARAGATGRLGRVGGGDRGGTGWDFWLGVLGCGVDGGGSVLCWLYEGPI